MQFCCSFEQLLECYDAEFLLVATLFILKVEKKMSTVDDKVVGVSSLSLLNSNQERLAWVGG